MVRQGKTSGLKIVVNLPYCKIATGRHHRRSTCTVETEDFIWYTLVRIDYASLYADLYNFPTKGMDMVSCTTMFSEASSPQYSVHRSHAVMF